MCIKDRRKDIEEAELQHRSRSNQRTRPSDWKKNIWSTKRRVE